MLLITLDGIGTVSHPELTDLAANPGLWAGGLPGLGIILVSY
jgi:hypothetical protein